MTANAVDESREVLRRAIRSLSAASRSVLSQALIVERRSASKVRALVSFWAFRSIRARRATRALERTVCLQLLMRNARAACQPTLGELARQSRLQTIDAELHRDECRACRNALHSFALLRPQLLELAADVLVPSSSGALQIYA